MSDDLVKIYSPELIRTTELSYEVKVHLEEGGQTNILFPKSVSTKTEFSAPFELCVKEWFLRRREEDLGSYIMCTGERL